MRPGPAMPPAGPGPGPDPASLLAMRQAMTRGNPDAAGVLLRARGLVGGR
jgi:hypothetical protein